MSPDAYRLIEDKLLPLALVVGAGFSYWLNLPDAFSGAVAAAGLVAFQVRKSSNPQS